MREQRGRVCPVYWVKLVWTWFFYQHRLINYRENTFDKIIVSSLVVLLIRWDRAHGWGGWKLAGDYCGLLVWSDHITVSQCYLSPYLRTDTGLLLLYWWSDNPHNPQHNPPPSLPRHPSPSVTRTEWVNREQWTHLECPDNYPSPPSDHTEPLTL